MEKYPLLAYLYEVMRFSAQKRRKAAAGVSNDMEGMGTDGAPCGFGVFGAFCYGLRPRRPGKALVFRKAGFVCVPYRLFAADEKTAAGRGKAFQRRNGQPY